MKYAHKNFASKEALKLFMDKGKTLYLETLKRLGANAINKTGKDINPADAAQLIAFKDAWGVLRSAPVGDDFWELLKREMNRADEVHQLRIEASPVPAKKQPVHVHVPVLRIKASPGTVPAKKVPSSLVLARRRFLTAQEILDRRRRRPTSAEVVLGRLLEEIKRLQ